jgi:outer membrane protein OmpA-like peptidoglycan-associated protein
MILGLMLVGSPALAQKSKIKKAYNHIEALDYESAIEALLPLAEQGDNAEVATLLGTIFRKQNSFGKSAVWYEKAVALPDVEPSAYFYYGMMLLHLNKCNEAQEQFDYFFSLKPLDPRQFQLKDACAFQQSLAAVQDENVQVQPLDFNSVFSDIGPAFYRNGLVFGSVRTSPNDLGLGEVDPFYDLYFVEGEKDRFSFGQPQSFSSRLNTKVHEAIVTFSQDESKIYFTRNQIADTEHSSVKATGLEIVYANSEAGDRWGDLQLLPFNSPKYSIAHPSLSPDGTMLFFSSDMPGGFGGKDIWITTFELDHWTNPVNLGPLVNTEGDEMFPFYHPSGKLYFSSDGQVGMGGQDIFITEPNKAGVWANVRNIGTPINTAFDDYGIIISPEEDYGYFTSTRPGGAGKDDIYGFRKGFRPDPGLLTQNEGPKDTKVVVHIDLLDESTGQRLENPVVKNCEANLYRSVGTSSFQMNLLPGDCCEVEIDVDGYETRIVEICGDPDNRKQSVTMVRERVIAPATEPGFDPEEVVTKSAPPAIDTPPAPTVPDPVTKTGLTEPATNPTTTLPEEVSARTPAATNSSASFEEDTFGEDTVRTVSNEPEETTRQKTPGVVEETTEIIRETTRARKTTKYLIGTVYDPLNSRPIPFATIHLLNSTCGVNLKIQSDESGHYRLPLISNCCINIRVEKEGFQTYSALEALCTDKAGNVKGSTSILLKPEPKEVKNEVKGQTNRSAFDGFERSKNTKTADAGPAYVLNVYYETGRTSVMEESVPELMKLLELLNNNPELVVEIGAHTDSQGTETFNQQLSQRRAENVVKFLVSQGIYGKRLIAKGYGEAQLINDCDDNADCKEEQHQVNRRTEFRVLGNIQEME